MSTGKKNFRSRFFIFSNQVASLLPEPSVLHAASEPVISPYDSDRCLAGHCLRRGGSFSHPSGSSAGGPVPAGHSSMNRKDGRNGHAPPVRLTTPSKYPGAANSSSAGRRFFSRCPTGFHLPAPGPIPPWRDRNRRPSRRCGTRKRSVPVRVHSILRDLAGPILSPGTRPPTRY
jgi:hypothetical protein